MIKFLIKRPIAVFMSFLAVLILSIYAIKDIPVSLLPETEVPELVVEVKYAGNSSLQIEKSVLQPMRLAFQGLMGLNDATSVASVGAGQIKLNFEYGTDMQLAYLHTNEKIDQSLNQLPNDLERPIVKRVFASNIPVARLQLTSDQLNPTQLSDFGRFVVQRRLEQQEGVSVVEVNGLTNKRYGIRVKDEYLDRFNLINQDLINAIKAANLPLSQIKVSEGNYEYDVIFENVLADPSALREIQLDIDDERNIPLALIADVELVDDRINGLHLFNGNKGLVYAIQKQSTESFFSLRDRLTATVDQLALEYPEVHFEITQDQFELLSESILQLVLSIILGTILAILILFLFSNDWRSPLIMGLLIPVSLLTSLLFFFLFNQSINIVSLSGILLGIGILIDNGIILIDNINEKRANHSLQEACRLGVLEIFPALISSTLTTLSVFIPLFLLKGTAGALFSAQVIALALVLVTSLLVSLLLLPVVYFRVKPDLVSDRQSFYARLLSLYKKSRTAKVNRLVSLFFVVITALGGVALVVIEKENLPEIKRNDLQVKINWSESISLEENDSRVNVLLNNLKEVNNWEADIGYNQIYEEGLNHGENALLYISFSDINAKRKAEKFLSNYISQHYPKAVYSITRPKNPFDQLFEKEKYFAVYKLRGSGESQIEEDIFRQMINSNVFPGQSFQQDSAIKIVFDRERLIAFGLTENQIIDKLRTHFTGTEITRIEKINESYPVVLMGGRNPHLSEINKIQVTVQDSNSYPIRHFIGFENETIKRNIMADLTGIYQDLIVATQTTGYNQLDQQIRNIAIENDILISLDGKVTELAESQWQLFLSILLAVLLLYIILSAQFESFKIPFIILAEIPVSASGALIGLWLLNQSLSIAALMGIIITLGIIVNDSILKVDTILRYIKEGMGKDEAIHKAGELRLKPIIMTSLTTILALTPVFFGSSLGADIQTPIAIAIIFGLIVGTICSVYLVPLLFDKLFRTSL